MTARLEQRLQSLRQTGASGLVSFTMAGDPDAATALSILHALVEAGVDVLELGMPFSDPMADGPVIQAAGLRALEGGMTLAGVLETVRQFRSQNTTTPIILMGYLNPVEQYGTAAFCADAESAGADGLILVDVPLEEEATLAPYLGGLAWIRLVAPTTTEARLPKLLKNASGFVYTIRITGITGAATSGEDGLADLLACVKRHTHLPVAVGFGISTREDRARAIAAGADLTVVGSALIKAMGNGTDAPEKARRFIEALL